VEGNSLHPWCGCDARNSRAIEYLAEIAHRSRDTPRHRGVLRIVAKQMRVVLRLYPASACGTDDRLAPGVEHRIAGAHVASSGLERARRCRPDDAQGRHSNPSPDPDKRDTRPVKHARSSGIDPGASAG
jgi:hypothetical protein